MIRKKDIPPSYSIVKKDKTVIILKDTYRKTITEMGLTDPTKLCNGFSQSADQYKGRGTVTTMALPGTTTERIVIRQYRRGGKIQKVLSDIYWGSSRPLKELWIGYQARRKGLPTAEVIAAFHHRIFWRFHRGHLVSREIMRGKDIISYLEGLSRPLKREEIIQKRKAITVVANLIRKMHDVGIWHADLNLKNIIIQLDHQNGLKGYIIDFDKSRMNPKLSENERVQNLLRLNRSAEKFKRKGMPITRTDTLRFLSAYYRNPPDFSNILRELNKKYQRHLRYHSLGKNSLKLF